MKIFNWLSTPKKDNIKLTKRISKVRRGSPGSYTATATNNDMRFDRTPDSTNDLTIITESNKIKNESETFEQKQEQEEAVKEIVAELNSMLRTEDPESDSLFFRATISRVSMLEYIDSLVRSCNNWMEEPSGKDSTGVETARNALYYLSLAKAHITPRSIHRYFLCAYVLSHKFREEHVVPNALWSDSLTPLKVLNELEIILYQNLNYNVTPRENRINEQ